MNRTTEGSPNPGSTVTVAPSGAAAITRRDLHFAIDDVDLKHWHGDGTSVSQFYNAMSLFFPEGEQFFIDSVRHYRERITDPALLADIKGFIGQEAMHGREHRAYNARLAEQGYDAELLEARALSLLNFARQHLPPIHHLAATIALEHFTAILADVLLREPRLTAGADPRMAALWRWHAVEETEHKAVAFDVFRAITRGSVRGYVLRCTVMVSVSIRFLWQTARTHYHLIRQDGEHRNLRGWLRLMNHLWGRPGLLRRIVLPWLAYFRPGFHPWQHDNRALLEGWQPVSVARNLPRAA
ncbi:metal-dependent hydrolase [Nevskia sp.]|uniref:metal-dependent hydrolase n=1 Tax=Nevskia sp. TaxID=1929292 RepID=UPI0025D62218|nr:metal-dependent hydrolase [Nevskia sp.]